LQQRIQNPSQVIRMTPGILQRIRQSLFWRATSGVEAQGGHLEHFNRQEVAALKPCFRRSISIW
jgi:hypothetical protein